MKRIKDIFSALKTLSNIPSLSIASAWGAIKEVAVTTKHPGTDDFIIAVSDVRLIDSIITAVNGVAKDDEDKAAAPGKADKPAS